MHKCEEGLGVLKRFRGRLDSFSDSGITQSAKGKLLKILVSTISKTRNSIVDLFAYN